MSGTSEIKCLSDTARHGDTGKAFERRERGLTTVGSLCVGSLNADIVARRHANDVAGRLGAMVAGARLSLERKPEVFVGIAGTMTSIRFDVTPDVCLPDVIDRLRDVVRIFDAAIERERNGTAWPPAKG